MKMSLLIAFLSAFLVAGCVDDDTYPVSGEECGLDDPVKEISALDCAAPRV